MLYNATIAKVFSKIMEKKFHRMFTIDDSIREFLDLYTRRSIPKLGDLLDLLDNTGLCVTSDLSKPS